MDFRVDKWNCRLVRCADICNRTLDVIGYIYCTVKGFLPVGKFIFLHVFVHHRRLNGNRIEGSLPKEWSAMIHIVDL